MNDATLDRAAPREGGGVAERDGALGRGTRPLLGVRGQPGRLALLVFRLPLPLPLYRRGWGRLRLLLVLLFAFGWSFASIPRPKQEQKGGQP